MLLRRRAETDDVADLDPVRIQGLCVRERLLARGEGLRFDQVSGPDNVDLPPMPMGDAHKCKHVQKIAGVAISTSSN